MTTSAERLAPQHLVEPESPGPVPLRRSGELIVLPGADEARQATASRSLLLERRLAALQAAPGARSIVKAAADRVAAAAGLVVLSPVLAAVAVAVKTSSPGPVFFSQERVGLQGSTFRIHKFRTMREGADHQLGDLLEQHGRHDQPLFKVPDDPRITGVGRVLRKTSLDELPQLANVLRGEMSIVGPRPQRPAEVALYEPDHADRLAMRPGITGLWQVSGRSDLAWEKAVQLDLRYVREWSLSLDLRILLRTVRVVLTGRGAH